MISVVIVICLGILTIGAAAGCVVFGIASIGTLLALGFEAGLFLMPIILIYLVARMIWRMTTASKTEKEKKSDKKDEK